MTEGYQALFILFMFTKDKYYLLFLFIIFIGIVIYQFAYLIGKIKSGQHHAKNKQ